MSNVDNNHLSIIYSGNNDKEKTILLSSPLGLLSVTSNSRSTIRRPYLTSYLAMKLAGFSIPNNIEDLSVSPLWLYLTSLENLYFGVRQSLKGMYKFRKQVNDFLSDFDYNLTKLRLELLTLTYRVNDYNLFILLEKKRRLNRTPRYRDKIVQYMINNVITKLYKPMFIYDSFSCIEGKGVQRGALRLWYFLRKATHQYKEPTFIKIDITKFFASIDHSILFNIIGKIIKCPYTLSLLYIIIESVEGPGLPLGNMISQTMANIYMNEFDQYVKHQLKINYYIRYADDMFFIVDGKERAKQLATHMSEWLAEHLKLAVNPKKTHISTKLDIPCLGYIIRYKNIKLQAKNMQKVKKAIAANNSNLVMSYRGLWHIANIDKLILYYTSRAQECVGKVQDVVERILVERRWEKRSK